MTSTRLHHEERGAGTCVVLVHAGFLDSRMWQHELEALSTTHRVVTFDARGVGLSPPASEPFSPADDLLGVLDAVGVERAHLVGISMGACAVLELAHARPDRVLSAMLVSVSMDDEASDELRLQTAALMDAFSARDRLRIVETLTLLWFDGRRSASQVDPAARATVRAQWDPWFVDAVAYQRWATLDELVERGPLRVPTCFLVGSGDWREIIASSADTRARLVGPDADSITIDGAGHLVNLDRPDAFLEHVRAFIVRHDPGAAG